MSIVKGTEVSVRKAYIQARPRPPPTLRPLRRVKVSSPITPEAWVWEQSHSARLKMRVGACRSTKKKTIAEV